MTDYPFPLDKKIEEKEEIEIVTPKIDPKTQKVEFEKEKKEVIYTTTYTIPIEKKLSCKKGEHEFYIKNPHNWVASCKKCYKNIYLNPLNMTIKNGKIVKRDTGDLIE